MTKDEALKLALEALESKYIVNCGAWRVQQDKAITAIKEALANEALEKMAENARELGLDYEPAQEPVAFEKTVCPFCSSEWVTAEQHDRKMDRLEQEPVAWRTYTGRGYYIIDATLEEAQKNWPDREHQPLYTTPPQRTWVGLTEDEILSISADCASSHQHTDIHFARAIEAALKAKNT